MSLANENNSINAEYDVCNIDAEVMRSMGLPTFFVGGSNTRSAHLSVSFNDVSNTTQNLDSKSSAPSQSNHNLQQNSKVRSFLDEFYSYPHDHISPEYFSLEIPITSSNINILQKTETEVEVDGTHYQVGNNINATDVHTTANEKVNNCFKN